MTEQEDVAESHGDADGLAVLTSQLHLGPYRDLEERKSLLRLVHDSQQGL